MLDLALCLLIVTLTLASVLGSLAVSMQDLGTDVYPENTNTQIYVKVMSDKICIRN